MTRKDYIAIAQAIKASFDDYPVQLRHTGSYVHRKAILTVVFNISEVFEADNPRFDKCRFLTACGVSHREDDGQTFHAMT